MAKHRASTGKRSDHGLGQSGRVVGRHREKRRKVEHARIDPPRRCGRWALENSTSAKLPAMKVNTNARRPIPQDAGERQAGYFPLSAVLRQSSPRIA